MRFDSTEKYNLPQNKHNMIPTEMKKHLYLDISICSTFTIDLIYEPLIWWLDKFYIKSNIKYTPYNQVFQEFYNPNGILMATPKGFHVFFIRPEDLIKDNLGSSEEKLSIVKEQLDALTILIDEQKTNCKRLIGILPISDTIRSEKFGIQMENLQEKWIMQLKQIQGIDVIDLRTVDTVANDKIHNKYTDTLAHIPYTEEYYFAMGACVSRNISSYYYMPFKVIVVDLDNTLWSGVCGEIGAENVIIDKGHREFQQFLIKCRNNGMLLAICSKNNEKDALNVFSKNLHMELTTEHFVSIKINWDNKYKNIRKIANELNLGLDSFIFIDDSEIECSEMMLHCPEILTLNIPTNTDLIMSYASNIWAFDTKNVSEEDKLRTSFYINEKLRNQYKKSAYDLEKYIDYLDVKVYIYPATELDVPRISQMTQRTNQFNFTTIRKTEQEISDIINTTNQICYVIEVEDRFGTYGVTGTLILEYGKNELVVTTFLLSCRILGRGVENQILGYLKLLCDEKQLSHIKVFFKATERNTPVKVFLSDTMWELKSQENGYDIYNINTSHIKRKNSVITKKYRKETTEKPQLMVESEKYYIDHIGLAVKNLDKIGELYQDLGYTVSETIHDPLQNVYLVMCHKEGHLPIELIGAVNSESPVNQYLEESDSVFYHICITINSFLHFANDLTKRNISFYLIDGAKEAVLFNNKKVGFIYIESFGLIEFIEDENYNKSYYYEDVLQLITSNIEIPELFFEMLGFYTIKRNSLVHSLKNSLNETLNLINKNNISDLDVVRRNYNLITYIEESNNTLPQTASNSKYINQLFFQVIDDVPDYIQNTDKCYFLADIPHIFAIANNTSAINEMKILIINKEHLTHRCHYYPLQYWNREITFNSINENNIPIPDTFTDITILELCKEVFNKHNIDLDSNFFKNGINSLKIIKLLSRIHNNYKIEIPISYVYRNPCIRSLIQYMKYNKTSSIKN